MTQLWFPLWRPLTDFPVFFLKCQSVMHTHNIKKTYWCILVSVIHDQLINRAVQQPCAQKYSNPSQAKKRVN